MCVGWGASVVGLGFHLGPGAWALLPELYCFSILALLSRKMGALIPSPDIYRSSGRVIEGDFVLPFMGPAPGLPRETTV